MVPDQILDPDEVIEKLAAEVPLKAKLVKLRFFGGISMREAVEFLVISATTGDCYWALARAFLLAEPREKPLRWAPFR